MARDQATRTAGQHAVLGYLKTIAPEGFKQTSSAGKKASGPKKTTRNGRGGR